jgi:hypothetical protein
MVPSTIAMDSNVTDKSSKIKNFLFPSIFNPKSSLRSEKIFSEENKKTVFYYMTPYGCLVNYQVLRKSHYESERC